mmetsp:Transcript_28080/g.87158  ORF Transcript_28080/g.87158 Transcript_28080/m.87158 type:complete len:243 (+) Transcript_28080:775-1503(+)
MRAGDAALSAGRHPTAVTASFKCAQAVARRDGTCQTRTLRSKPPVTNASPDTHAQQQTAWPCAKTMAHDMRASPGGPDQSRAVASALTVTNVVASADSGPNAQPKTAASWPSSSRRSASAASLGRRQSSPGEPRDATRTTPSAPPQAASPRPPAATHQSGPPQTWRARTSSRPNAGAGWKRSASSPLDALRLKLRRRFCAVSTTSVARLVPAAATARSTSAGLGCKTSQLRKSAMTCALSNS